MMAWFMQQSLEFVQPQWLWLLVPPVFFLCIGILLRIFSRKALQKNRESVLGMVRQSRLNWRICIAAVLVSVGLARPYLGETNLKVATVTSSRQVIIALDVSRSMLVDDVKPNRLDRAKILIRSLLDPLAGEQVGLILFAGTAFLQCPMSSDHDVLREMLPAVGPDFIPRGGTNYDSMLQTALTSFPKDPNAAPILIVMSDGEALDDAWQRHIPQILERGISVITLGIGTEAGGLVPAQAGGFERQPDGAPVLSRLEPQTLMELATATGGIYLDASKWVDLSSVVNEVEKRRASLDKKEKNITQRNEIFFWFLSAAVVFVLWALFSEVPIRPARRRVSSVRRLAAGVQDGIMYPTAMVGSKSSLTKSLVGALGIFYAVGLHAQPSISEQVPLLRPQTSQIGDMPSAAPDARLRLLETVRALSTLGNATPAKDYARLARDILHYLEADAQQMTVATIRSLALDGLDAVRRGSIRAPSAEPWDDLREELERWLKENPPEEDQQQDQDQNQQEQDQNKDGENGDQQNEGDNSEQKQDGSQGENSEQQSRNQQGNSQEQKEEGDLEQKNDSSQDSKQGDKQNQSPHNDDKMNPKNEGDRPLKDDGRKDGKEENKPQDGQGKPTPQPQPTPRPMSQRIGGQSVKQSDELFESLPQEIREALMQLEQARQADRPAVLFERMATGEERRPEGGKNW